MTFGIWFACQILTPHFGGRDHLVSAVQRQGKRKKDGSTPTIFLSWKDIEKKLQYQKRNLDMEKSIVTRKKLSRKALGTKAPWVNDDALQPGGALSRQLNHDKPQCPKPVTVSGVAFKLCRWDIRENIIAQV